MNSTNQEFQIPSLENLSLGGEQFQIPNLTNLSNSISDTNQNSTPTQGISLSALASEHLTQNSSNSSNLLNFDLGPVFGTKPEEGTLSLADIANLHLVSNTDLDKGAFEIPSLSGSEANKKVTVPNLQFKNFSEATQDIDLNLALAATKNIKYTKKEDSPAPAALEEKKVPIIKVPFETEILVKNNHWNKENFQCAELQKASTLGKVVCRRWKTKSLLTRKKEPKRKLVQHKINPFLFDSSSPDDIIRKAQSQSFNRVQPK